MMSLQAVYGIIPKVFGKGRAAKQLYDFMARFVIQLILFRCILKQIIEI
jgi:hypothetical protein